VHLTPDVVERLRGHRVLVVGDVMVDEYVRGEVARISPEAPVPVLEVRGSERRLGGAANTAANIARLGGAVSLVGVVGDDAEAGALRTDLQRVGITAVLCADPARPTTRKTRFVAQQQQIVRIDHESRAAIHGSVAHAVTDAIRAELATASAVVLSDYAKGLVTTETAQTVTATARERGVPVIVDPKQHDFGMYRGATVITPNLIELERAAAAPTATSAQIEHAVRRLAASIGDTSLLVTRGADGMTLYGASATASPYHVPAATREVFDVTGAGDTVVATVALALAAGLTLEAAVELASLAAGIAVSKRGTSTVEPAELAAAIASGGRPP
jgi:D-beta-D-heptose 7-phosphate kinase/D-beta-D-heptose 1-phosphate adenosyltransferase